MSRCDCENGDVQERCRTASEHGYASTVDYQQLRLVFAGRCVGGTSKFGPRPRLGLWFGAVFAYPKPTDHKDFLCIVSPPPGDAGGLCRK